MTNLTRLVKPQPQSPITAVPLQQLIRQKSPASYNDNKDEKQFNIMLDFSLPPFRDPPLPIAYLNHSTTYHSSIRL